MNPRVLLIGLSLAANVALGAWLALRPPAAPATASAGGGPIPAATPVPVDPLAEPITLATWNRLAAAPDGDYAARLQAEGLPPLVAWAMLRARISARYSDRLKALLPPAGKDEYWRRSFVRPDATMTAEARAQRRQIGREIDDAVRAAGLGAGGDRPTASESAARQRNFGPLTAAQVEQIAAIQRDYADLRTQIRENMQGVTMPEDRAQLRLLEQEQRNDLAALLSPAELLEFDLRSSDAANQVRSTALFFEPTEAEYRALVQLRLAFNQQYGGSNLSEEEQAAKRAAEATYLEKVAGLLTPERFAEYKLTSSSDFKNTASALGRFNFDLPVVREVMTLRQSITNRVTALQANKLYTAEQRAAELAALHREASSQLTSRLGAKAYEAFVAESAGSWLRRLQPATANPGSVRP